MQLMAHRRLLIHFHTFHEFVGHLPWAIRQNDGFGLKNLSEENLENAHQVSIFEHVYSHFIVISSLFNFGILCVMVNQIKF